MAEAAPQFGPFSYTMSLVRVGPDRLGAMHAIREYRPDIGGAEAKRLIDNLPQTIVTVVGHDSMQRVRRRFERIGAVVEVADDAG